MAFHCRIGFKTNNISNIVTQNRTSRPIEANFIKSVDKLVTLLSINKRNAHINRIKHLVQLFKGVWGFAPRSGSTPRLRPKVSE